MHCLRPVLSVLVIAFGILSSLSPSYAAPVGEVEPNDTAPNATTLLPGLSGVGTINAGAEFDLWQLSNIRREDINFVYLATSTSTSNGDSIVSIFPGGATNLDTAASLFYNDDGGPRAPGAFSSSTLNGFSMPANGTMLIRVDGFGSSTLTPYELYHATISPNEFVSEIEPNDTSATAMEVNAPAISAQGGDDDDYFTFHAGEGDRIVAMVQNSLVFAPAPEAIFQSKLEILSTDGATVLSTDATFTAAKNAAVGGNTAGPVVVATAGQYFVRIRKEAGVGNPYRLVILVEGDAVQHGACCLGAVCDLRSNVNCFGAFMGVGTSCSGDQDTDGIVDDCDNCSIIANASQENNDNDGAGNACETCVDDSLKFVPGQCGCGIVDTDTDRDGTADCSDTCANDPAKTGPGACGCGVVDSDANSNGVADCNSGADIKSQIQSVVTKLTALKRLRSEASNKKKKAAKVALKAIRAVLDNVNDRVVEVGTSVAVADAQFILSEQVAQFTKFVNSALRANRKAKFNKLKKKALTDAEGLVAGIV